MLLILIWILFSFAYNSGNRYVSKHKQKNINDKHYSDYLKWCLKNGEIPAKKESVLKDVEEKENNLKSLIK